MRYEEELAMKRIVPLCALVLCALIIGLGCGDDKTTTITEYDTVTVFDTVPMPMLAKGFARLMPVSGLRISGQKIGFSTATPSEKIYPSCHVDFYGTEPIRPEISSVIIADSVCVVELCPNALWSTPYSYADYSNLGDTMRFTSGDTIDFVINSYYTVSTGQVTLLDYVDDRVDMVDAVTPDTVWIDSSLTVLWNIVPNAEWYGVAVQYTHGASGVVSTYTEYDYTMGTTYTIPGSEILYDGHIHIYVVPTTGPVPHATAGNITGGAVVGTIYSYALSTMSFVYVGTGSPVIPPLAKGLPGVSEETPDDPPVDGWDIIEAITSR